VTSSTTADATLRPADPSDAEFALLATLIEREAGIHLTPPKKALLASRLAARLRELRLPSYGAYYRFVGADHASGGGELTRLLDAVCTHETHFFREPHHFELIARDLAPGWRAAAREGRRERRVRVWSAGCSSGEEPYTLAMLLRTVLPERDGWHIEILATDLSTRVLARAEAAVYPSERLREVPIEHRRRAFLRGTGAQAGRIKIVPELRRLVTFQRLNLSAPGYAVPAGLDLVLCRNVLIYFRPELRRKVVEELCSHLAPGGHLFLGHAESLHSAGLPLVTRVPTVYQRLATGAPR
jgi:chemotaxis protein methyltransferase CheR